MKKDKRLIIIGAGGFGLETAQWAKDGIIANSNNYKEIFFIDDDESKRTKLNKSYNFIGNVKSYKPDENDEVVISVSNPLEREKIRNNLVKKKVIFGKVVHPSCIITETSKTGSGLIISPWSIISSYSIVGNHVHINIMTSIGHHTKIGSFSSFSSHVDITANCEIGERVYFGSGSRSIPNCKIASDTIVGAGAVVQRSINKKTTLFQTSTRRI